MTRYNTLNVKLFTSKLNKLKAGMKNGTKVNLKISSSVVGDSNDENNFPHKLLLLIHKFQSFIKLLHIIPQLIKKFQNLSCIK